MELLDVLHSSEGGISVVESSESSLALQPQSHKPLKPAFRASKRVLSPQMLRIASRTPILNTFLVSKRAFSVTMAPKRQKLTGDARDQAVSPLTARGWNDLLKDKEKRRDALEKEFRFKDFVEAWGEIPELDGES
jgi:hypothetical protein